MSIWAEERGARSERFPMNGRALCLMTRPMFSDREPDRGAAMYQVTFFYYLLSRYYLLKHRTLHRNQQDFVKVGGYSLT